MATTTSTGTIGSDTSVTSPGTVSSSATAGSGTVSSGTAATPVRERDEADKQIAENLAKPPEAPAPSQEEADQIKERALRPAQSGSGYQTR